MTRETAREYTLSSSYSPKTFFFQTPIGIGIIVAVALGGTVGTLHGGQRIIDHYFPEPARVVQQNVLGKDKPEVFTEINGVRYYSHVDGKEISDLFQK